MLDAWSAVAGYVGGTKTLELRAIGVALDGHRRHNDRVFVVVGVVALANSDPPEAILLVQSLRREVARPAFERHNLLLAALRQLDRGDEQQLAQSAAPLRLGDGDRDDVRLVDHEPD